MYARLTITLVCAFVISSAYAEITDGYTFGSKIHMNGGNNHGKKYDGFILNRNEKKEDILVLNGKFKDAFPIYEKKANDGDIDSIHNLGLMYIKGLGVKKDIEHGITLLETSYERRKWDADSVPIAKAKKELNELKNTTERGYIYEEEPNSNANSGLSYEPPSTSTESGNLSKTVDTASTHETELLLLCIVIAGYFISKYIIRKNKSSLEEEQNTHDQNLRKIFSEPTLQAKNEHDIKIVNSDSAVNPNNSMSERNRYSHEKINYDVKLQSSINPLKFRLDPSDYTNKNNDESSIHEEPELQKFSIEISGYGSECVVGTIPFEVFRFWSDREDKIEEHITDWNSANLVPEDMDLRDWEKHDDIIHITGALIGKSKITIRSESGETIWSSTSDLPSITSKKIRCLEDRCVDSNSLDEGYYFTALTQESGILFSSSFSAQSFIPELIQITYITIFDRTIITDITYNDTILDMHSNRRTLSTKFNLISIPLAQDPTSSANINPIIQHKQFQFTELSRPCDSFGFSITNANASDPDDDGDIVINIEGHLINTGSANIDYFSCRLFVFNESNLCIHQTNREVSEELAIGEISDLQISSFYIREHELIHISDRRDMPVMLIVDAMGEIAATKHCFSIPPIGSEISQLKRILLVDNVYLSNITIHTYEAVDSGKCKVKLLVQLDGLSNNCPYTCEISSSVFDGIKNVRSKSNSNGKLGCYDYTILEDSHEDISRSMLVSGQIEVSIKIISLIGQTRHSWRLGNIPEAIKLLPNISTETKLPSFGHGNMINNKIDIELSNTQSPFFDVEILSKMYSRSSTDEDTSNIDFCVDLRLHNKSDLTIDFTDVKLILINQNGVVLKDESERFEATVMPAGNADIKSTISLYSISELSHLYQSIENVWIIASISPYINNLTTSRSIAIDDATACNCIDEDFNITPNISIKDVTMNATDLNRKHSNIDLNFLVHNNQPNMSNILEIETTLYGASGDMIFESKIEERLLFGQHLIMNDSISRKEKDSLHDCKMQMTYKLRALIGVNNYCIKDLHQQID